GLARIIDGKALAAQLRMGIAERAQAFRARQGRAPHLAVVLANANPASALYVKNKGKAAAEAGIESTQHDLPLETSARDLLALVRRLNEDRGVDGVLVQLPLPPQHDTA